MKCCRAYYGLFISAAVLSTLLSFGKTAYAQETPTRVEIFTAVANGSARSVSMGGTALAGQSGSNDVLSNPAIAAIRPDTKGRGLRLDLHFDRLDSVSRLDFENDGWRDEKANLTSTGFLLGIGNLGFSFGARRHTLETADKVELTADTGYVTLAGGFMKNELSLGISFVTTKLYAESSAFDTVEQSSSHYQLGGVYKPRSENWRIGATFLTGSSTEDADECSVTLCQNFTPENISSPWQLGVGAAYRHVFRRVGNSVFPGSIWNQRASTRFRDEPALTVAADIVEIGPADDNSVGVEAFLRQVNKPVRTTMSTSIRLGAEFEWPPGRLRTRIGSYLEPQRHEGTNSRIHATAGVEVRLFQFWLFGQRRLKINLLSDFAREYRRIGFGIGFWN